jgi:hypothetical protein
MNSMEFHEKFHGKFRGIPLNFPWNSINLSFIKFHGIPLNSMEFHEKFHGKFRGIPLNSMEYN